MINLIIDVINSLDLTGGVYNRIDCFCNFFSSPRRKVPFLKVLLSRSQYVINVIINIFMKFHQQIFNIGKTKTLY